MIAERRPRPCSPRDREMARMQESSQDYARPYGLGQEETRRSLWRLQKMTAWEQQPEASSILEETEATTEEDSAELPEPELLDFSIEPGSVGYMEKATAIPKVHDFFSGGAHRRVLEDRIREHSMAFADRMSLRPGREELVRQLNEGYEPIREATGVAMRFE